MECEICHTTLTESELSHYKYPEESVLVCQKHWCNCMPKSTPWSWIQTCDYCNNTLCKSCYGNNSKGEKVCNRCYKIT